MNLYAVALRTRQRLLYDGAAKMTITNVPDANRYLAARVPQGMGTLTSADFPEGIFWEHWERGGGADACCADPLGMPIGCQVYPVREALGKDFDGTLRGCGGHRVRTIEMCSPPGYGWAGFGPLAT